MLAKRIIPCLDVKEGKVVKGIKFKDHCIVGDIVAFAEYYAESGADELVFYDITASSDQRAVSTHWIKKIAERLTIPFCVAGGIRSLSQAETILNAGADKISINSPALENPELINQLSEVLGKQCVVIGIDSTFINEDYRVYQYTGDNKKTLMTNRLTLDWVQEVEARGAGEIVLNCMSQDGCRNGYDIKQLTAIRKKTHLPLIASGGAGKLNDFSDVFNTAKVDGALAASVFHSKSILISELKQFLREKNIGIRL